MKRNEDKPFSVPWQKGHYLKEMEPLEVFMIKDPTKIVHKQDWQPNYYHLQKFGHFFPGGHRFASAKRGKYIFKINSTCPCTSKWLNLNVFAQKWQVNNYLNTLTIYKK